MRRRSATWTACCRPRTSRAPMPSSSVGRPRRTYPSRVCQRRACTSCSPARRPIRRCTRPSRPMRGGPCANTSGTRTSMPRTAPCRAASPCSRWAAPARRTRRWCSTICPGGRRASIHAWPLCRRLSRRPWLHREAIAYLLACAGNIQHLRHRKTYAERIANADSLGWLLEARRRVAGDAPSSIAALRANLLGERVDEAAFRAARHAIWGEQADKDRGGQVIRKAPEALRALYTEIFADEPGR